MTNKGSDNRPETGLLLKSWRSSDLLAQVIFICMMMTGISLRAFAGQIGSTSYTRTGTREAIGAIDGAEVGAECRLVPWSVPRQRAASDLSSPAANEPLCQSIACEFFLDFSYSNCLGASAVQVLLNWGCYYYAGYGILDGTRLPSRSPSIHSARAT